ncbi:unnamed protein product [Leptosia nina]|uniref:Kinetochore protein SPC25 n=1 Tax=Leptosia nina TaxID=320188 RepID=A0AAV1JE11_9NEOP
MNVVEESLNFMALEDVLFKNTEADINSCTQEILSIFQNTFPKAIPYNDDNSAHTHEEQLQILSNSNQSLRKEIDEKIRGLAIQQSQYENYKQEHKFLTCKIKDTHESFLMARKCYKKYLNFYYTIESRDKEQQTIFVQFFSESKSDSEKYSVRLLRNTKTGKYSLLSIHPKDKINLKDAQIILEENNNVPGLLSFIRQKFYLLKYRKK